MHVCSLLKETFFVVNLWGGKNKEHNPQTESLQASNQTEHGMNKQIRLELAAQCM